MLTEIRDRSSGWFAWIIAALIIIPMAFWGVQEYASTEARPTLVEVGDQKITQNEFQARLNNEQQRMRQAMGDRVNNELLNSDGFKQNVLQQMVNRALVQHVADEYNYRVGDDQLAAAIRNDDLFKIDGEFNQEAYDRYVQGTFYSKTRFEEELRNGTRLGQVTSGYQDSALVLTEEVRALLELQAEQRTFDILTIKQADFKDQVEVSDGDVGDYYQQNTDQFMEPEKTSISYVELSLEQILPEVSVDEEDLRAAYEENAASYVSQEKRAARHILLSTNNDEDEDAQEVKAEELVTQLRAGADFAELARANSQDPGSAANGGDLGIVERGQMVPEFEEATFALEKDAISDPVKSQFGYHIIQVLDIETPEQQSFEEVRADLEREERQRLAEETLLERLDEMRNLAYEQPDELAGLAEALSLQVYETALFDRNSGVGIASNRVFREAAFSEEVQVDEINSEPLELQEGQYVVMRKLNYRPSQPQNLEVVSERIESILMDQKAAEAAASEGQRLADRAELNWSSLADEEDLEIVTHTVSLADTERKVSSQVLEKIASMRLPGGTPEVATIEAFNGDVHIVRLTKIAPGDVNTLSEQIKDSTRRLVAQRNGQSLVVTYLDSLRDKLAPQINNDLL